MNSGNVSKDKIKQKHLKSRGRFSKEVRNLQNSSSILKMSDAKVMVTFAIWFDLLKKKLISSKFNGC